MIKNQKLNIEKKVEKKPIGRREEKRADLKKRLLDSAFERIKLNGVNGLKARDITADAGCALGGLYTAYDSLEDLIIHVNSCTLGLMETALSAEAAGHDKPVEQFRALTRAYLAFAQKHMNLWRALFDANFILTNKAPEWHIAEQEKLLLLICTPLAQIYPSLNERALAARARTFFSAVHGIVTLSLEERFISLEGDELNAELDHFVSLLVAGSEIAD